MADDPARMPPALISIRTTWGALTIGVLAYVVIAYMVRPQAAPASAMLPDAGNPVELALSIAALGAVAAGVVVPRWMLAAARVGAGAAASPSEDTMIRAATVPLTVRYAFFESAAIMGFVLVLLGAPALRVVPFVALSVAALLACFPTRERIVRMCGG